MSWRKSWPYPNIHGKNGEGSKRKLLPDERSVWDDYLDLAAISPIQGQVCIAHNVGYTPQQLSEILKTPTEIVQRANKHMTDLAMITIDNTGVILINNWNVYESEYDRLKVYKEDTLEGTLKGTSKSNTKQYAVDKNRIDKKYIRKDYISIYTSLLNYWNSKKIITHKYLTDKCYGIINGKLDNGYTLKELKQAIDNYSYILIGKQFFWNYKWTLQDFLVRGLDKFMDIETAKQNYKAYDKGASDETKEDRAILRKEMFGEES